MELTYMGVTTPDWMREPCRCTTYYGTVDPATVWGCGEHSPEADSWRDGVRAAQEHLAAMLAV